MPQGEWERSLVANGYPLLPDDAQIVIQDDVGVDNPLDANEVSIVPRRELVSLDNASVNIDNSNDVIIGPVTQFNVTGNVIIRQRENERASQDEDNEGDGVKSKTGDEPTWRKLIPKNNKTLKYTVLLSLGLVIIVVPIMVVKLLPVHATESHSTPSPCHGGEKNYVTKQTWHGSEGKSQVLQNEPPKLVIVKHTAGRFCSTLEYCSTLTRNIQDYHLSKGAPDIWYNFLVGGDGRIYIGRGFGVENQFTNDTLDVAIHGNFTYDEFFPNMIQATKDLLEVGIQNGHLAEDYRVVCHNQTFRKTLSPGRNVYKHVILWDRYDNGTYFD